MSNSYTIPRSTLYNSNAAIRLTKERREKRVAVREKYEKFVAEVPKMLVTEALDKLLQSCLDNDVSSENREYGKRLCAQYVQEQGVDNLLRRFRTKSVFLAEMASVIDEASKKITGKADPENELTITIKSKDSADFFKGLEGLQMDQITDKICERVCDSTEEFIQNNVKDKVKLQELANKAKENVDRFKTDNEEAAKAIEHEQVRMYNSGADSIRNNRKRNVYEQMVNQVATLVVKDDDKRTVCTTEDGKLDVPKIQSKVDVMYTFLEMLNTAKIHKVDERYITEVINSIK